MKRRKAKNKQVIFSLVLILALAAIVSIVQFDPSGKFTEGEETSSLVTSGNGDSEAGVEHEVYVMLVEERDVTLYEEGWGVCNDDSDCPVAFECDGGDCWPKIESDNDCTLHYGDNTKYYDGNCYCKENDEEYNYEVYCPTEGEWGDFPDHKDIPGGCSCVSQPVTGSQTNTPEIQINLQSYLESDPDFNSRPYPVNSNIVFNVENSTVDGELMASGALNIEWTWPDGNMASSSRETKAFSTLETINVSVTLWIPNTLASETETVEIEIYNGLNPILLTPEDNAEITLGVFTEFREESTSLSEPITLWVLDFGDESEPWGYLGVRINQQACFSSTDATLSCVTGIIKDSDAIGDPCACSSEVSRIYPTTTVETSVAPGIRYHTYETVDDCGDDFICTVNLTVSTASYSESESIDLKFNQEDICEAHPALDECQPAPVVDPCIANPNMIGCQDEPEGTIDSDFDPLTTDTTGQDNYVSQEPPPSEDDFDPLEGLGDEPPEEPEGTGIGKIVLILILLSALGGAGFYMWKRGMFSKLKLPGKAKVKSTETTSSPIQTYIAKAKSAGESNVVIKQNLKNSGWPEEEINKHLK
jgi:hypothetical protein